VSNLAGTTTNAGTINGGANIAGGTLNTNAATSVVNSGLTNAGTVNAAGKVCGTINNAGGTFNAVGTLTSDSAFNGGRLSSDSGVMLFALAERRRKVADTIAAHIADRRTSHIRSQMCCAPACWQSSGYPDGDEFDWLRYDQAFRLACGRLPYSGADLCSQRPSRAGRIR
jgi:hypothetical protein